MCIYLEYTEAIDCKNTRRGRLQNNKSAIYTKVPPQQIHNTKAVWVFEILSVTFQISHTLRATRKSVGNKDLENISADIGYVKHLERLDPGRAKKLWRSQLHVVGFGPDRKPSAVVFVTTTTAAAAAAAVVVVVVVVVVEQIYRAFGKAATFYLICIITWSYFPN